MEKMRRVSIVSILTVGKQAARQADGNVGKGGWKKQKPSCNEADTGCGNSQHYPTRKRADFHLVKRY